jgi:MFS family permease
MTTHSALPQTNPALSLSQVLICGAAIVTLAMGIRHGFGLWLQPITTQYGWTRENFAFAIAIQNLSWGVTGIAAGMLADKFGAFKVIIGGALLYALGLISMAYANTPFLFALSAGILIGAAQSGTTYAVIYGVIGRNVSAEKRSWAMGVAAAAGSFGQFLMVPTEGFLINAFGWQQALMMLGFATLLMIPLSFGLREHAFSNRAAAVKRDQTIVEALTEAFKYPSFQLLMAGYFVCGFQVVFIGVHLPSYLKDKGLSPQVASYALALVGLFNVFGTYLAGSLGQKMKKTKILSFIYFARAVVVTIFILAPLTPMSVYLFASCMGLLWLSTVPPTNAVVAQIFGIQHLSMLSGFVFFSHQIGSFLGAWMGAVIFDANKSYDVMWYIIIALGLFGGLINMPVKETAVPRSALKPA